MDRRRGRGDREKNRARRLLVFPTTSRAAARLEAAPSPSASNGGEADSQAGDSIFSEDGDGKEDKKRGGGGERGTHRGARAARHAGVGARRGQMIVEPRDAAAGGGRHRG